ECLRQREFQVTVEPITLANGLDQLPVVGWLLPSEITCPFLRLNDLREEERVLVAGAIGAMGPRAVPGLLKATEESCRLMPTALALLGQAFLETCLPRTVERVAGKPEAVVVVRFRGCGRSLPDSPTLSWRIWDFWDKLHENDRATRFLSLTSLQRQAKEVPAE